MELLFGELADSSDDFTRDFPLGPAVYEATATIFDEERMKVFAGDTVEEKRGDRTVDAPEAERAIFSPGFVRLFIHEIAFSTKSAGLKSAGFSGVA